VNASTVRWSWFRGTGAVSLVLLVAMARSAPSEPVILTPPAPATPRINGPWIYGVRPGAPFLYSMPVTGERPVHYGTDGLPDGLVLDGSTGIISGRLRDPGRHRVTLRASNVRGVTSKIFEIVVGEEISLTPAMGWNSWNCWGEAVDQEKMLRVARALVASGLADHVSTFVNIDDGWQGRRSAPSSCRRIPPALSSAAPRR